jgi:predicted dehydrogenase
MRDRVKAALVGISGYGLSYLDALLNGAAASAGVDLVAAVDPMAEQSRRVEELRDRRVPIYPSLPAMFKGSQGVQLVMLVTPIHLHAPQTCLALQHGASVLCEKPLAGSLADARRVVACERRAGGRNFVAVGYQWSYSAAVQALKRDVMSGALGRPVRLRCMVSFPRALSYFKRNDWAGRLKTPAGEDVLDSPVNNATAHYLHNMLYVLGPTRETSAAPATVQAELYRANDIENFDTAALRIVARCARGGGGGDSVGSSGASDRGSAGDAGVPILFYTTHAAADRIGPRAVYEFERAVVTYDDDAGAGHFVAHFNDGAPARVYGNPNLDRHEKIWQSAEAVRHGMPVACGPSAALSQTLCAVAAQQSMPAIGSFPRDVVRRVDLGDDAMLAVHGLDDVLHSAYDRGVLFSELGRAPWAKPGKVIRIPAEGSVAAADAEDGEHPADDAPVAEAHGL